MISVIGWPPWESSEPNWVNREMRLRTEGGDGPSAAMITTVYGNLRPRLGVRKWPSWGCYPATRETQSASGAIMLTIIFILVRLFLQPALSSRVGAVRSFNRAAAARMSPIEAQPRQSF